MTDYKATLNLPQTRFPMKANLAQKEPTLQAFWRDKAIYQALRTARAGQKSFILHDGPPYANGEIHLGHAVNKILKDFIIKSKSLSGFDCPYIPGWDCHGLPIELNVEKKVGKPGRKISAEAFREKCRQYATKQYQQQSLDFQRLGVLADWQNPYLTMDSAYEAEIIRTLGRIIEKGHLIRGNKPVHWCPACGSALAEAEIEYIDKESPAIDVMFYVQQADDWYAAMQVTTTEQSTPAVVIWTTTPWTLPANEAIAVNPTIDYVMVTALQAGVRRCLVVAALLLDALICRAQLEQVVVIGRARGADLEQLTCQHPFIDQSSPILLGQHVTTDAGTGCVHTAPGHGLEDYQVGLDYDLPIEQPVMGNGRFREDTPIVGGESLQSANEILVAHLSAQGHLLHAETITHSYPHCWRHKIPILFRATPQWFISMSQAQLKTACLRAIEQVKWLPDWGQARITAMVANSPDWCISRQRTWVVPIPIFLHKETGEHHPNTQQHLATIADAVEQQGLQAWYGIDKQLLLGEADALDYEACHDGLDVWFDSGVSHAAVLKKRHALSYPADLYLEGSDQHRGWFQSSLRTAIADNDTPPYRQVLTHGFTVDEQGRKMSKSLGNTIRPQTVINTMGADVLRLWVAATDYRAELTLSDEVLHRIADSYRKIRNTCRFLLANLSGYDNQQHAVHPEHMLQLDIWLVQQALSIQKDIIAAYDSYQFHRVYQSIQHFCINDLGGFYLDIIKDRQYTCPTNSIARRSAQTAIFHVLHLLVRWLAPILSFTAEEIWQHMDTHTDVASIFLCTWHHVDVIEKGVDPRFDWSSIIALRQAVNKQLEESRQSGVIGSSLEAELTLFVSSEWLDKLACFDNELRFVFITSSARIAAFDVRPEHAVPLALPGQVACHVDKSTYVKCARCWHRCQSVGQSTQHPTLCQRCITNIDSEVGEIRRYA